MFFLFFLLVEPRVQKHTCTTSSNSLKSKLFTNFHPWSRVCKSSLAPLLQILWKINFPRIFIRGAACRLCPDDLPLTRRLLY